MEPSERLLIDGMNVLGSRPDGWWRDRDGAVRRLAGRLRELGRSDRVEVVLVLDGRPIPGLPESDGGDLAVRYARRAGRDGTDDRIVELVAAAADPAALTVVTADRALRARLEPFGVRLAGPRSLLARLPD